MAYLLRVVLGVCLSLVSVVAFASFPPTGYTYRVSGTNNPFTTPDAACQQYAAQRAEGLAGVGIVSYTFNFSFVNEGGQGGGCNMHGVRENNGGSFDQYDGPFDTGPGACPANSTASGGSCTCNSGFDEAGSSCVPHVVSCPAGQHASGSTCVPDDNNNNNNPPPGNCKGDIGGSVNFNFGPITSSPHAAADGTRQGCFDNCVYKGQSSLCAGSADGKSWICTIEKPATTGATCDSSLPAGDGSAADKLGQGNEQNVSQCNLAAGMVQGTVNGVSVCVKSGSSSSSSTSTKTSSDPAKPVTDTTNTDTSCTGSDCSTTTTQTQTNGDGTSTVIVTTRSCSGSTCSTNTTTTKKDANGNPTDTKTDAGTGNDKASFCKENPDFAGCKQSAFGGQCGGGFSCDGDAIQCAIAREVYTRDCDWADKGVTGKDSAYDAAAAKTGDQTGDLPGNDSKNIDGSSFDMTDAIGGAACITDKQITVWGSAVTLPFSGICPSLAWMGNLLVAVSLLLAVRIVTRG